VVFLLQFQILNPGAGFVAKQILPFNERERERTVSKRNIQGINGDHRTQQINVAIIVQTYNKSGNAWNISAQNSSFRYRLQSLLESQHGKEICLFSKLSETSLGLT
jgi:hypothetical protein